MLLSYRKSSISSFVGTKHVPQILSFFLLNTELFFLTQQASISIKEFIRILCDFQFDAFNKAFCHLQNILGLLMETTAPNWLWVGDEYLKCGFDIVHTYIAQLCHAECYAEHRSGGGCSVTLNVILSPLKFIW